MMSHKICFYEEIWLIIPKSNLLPHLIRGTAPSNQYVAKHFHAAITIGLKLTPEVFLLIRNLGMVFLLTHTMAVKAATFFTFKRKEYKADMSVLVNYHVFLPFYKDEQVL